jgi:hypothetical protein
VLTVLAVDVISSIGNYAYVYLVCELGYTYLLSYPDEESQYTVSNWGNPAFLMRQQWPGTVEIFHL